MVKLEAAVIGMAFAICGAASIAAPAQRAMTKRLNIGINLQN
jgi:uncharacterized membrane protein YadS